MHCFGVIDFLVYHFPKTNIDWVCENPFASLLEKHPLIDRVIVSDTKKWRKSLKYVREMFRFLLRLRKREYDVIFDLQGNVKSGLVTFFAKSVHKVGFGKKSVPEWPNLLATGIKIDVDVLLQINRQYLSVVEKYFQKNSPENFFPVSLDITPEDRKKLHILLGSSAIKERRKFMVCPGSNWPNKRLSEDTLIAFLTLLEKEYDAAFIFVFGNREEEVLAFSLESRFYERSVIIGNLDFALWQQLMESSDCIISMDSSPLHLCATTSTPSFSVFGPSSAKIYRPFGERHYAYQGACPYGRSFKKRCEILRTCETGACMRDLSALSLAKAFNSWWRSQVSEKSASSL